MPDHTILVEEIQILAEQPTSTVLVDEVEQIEILAVAQQGPPGASWPEPFALAARFGEIASDPVAKELARTNLDLQNIDCGTFT